MSERNKFKNSYLSILSTTHFMLPTHVQEFPLVLTKYSQSVKDGTFISTIQCWCNLYLNPGNTLEANRIGNSVIISTR